MDGIYWIDAGVLIQAKNGLFAMDIVPTFWTFIETKLKDGSVRMPKMCFDEVTDGNDELARWCKQRRNIGYFCCKASSDKDVQTRYSKIAEHVVANHSRHAAAEFLRGADGWVIAHALATSGYVVTEELRNNYKSKIKIPVISKTLKATWKPTHQMCRELGFKAGG